MVSCSVNLGACTVNRHHFFLADRAQAVHRAAHHVEHPAQAGFTHRHHDLLAGILDGHAAYQTVGDVHGDGPNNIVAQMLGHLDDQIVLLVTDGRVADRQRRVNRRQIALFELHVDDRAHHLRYPSNIFSHLKTST